MFYFLKLILSKLIKQNKTISNVIQRNKLVIFQITVPSEQIGTIIGKGGETINQIRDKSRAKIEIDTSTYGSDERIISVIGTPLQIQMVQRLIQERLTNQLSSLMLQVTTINRTYGTSLLCDPFHLCDPIAFMLLFMRPHLFLRPILGSFAEP